MANLKYGSSGSDVKKLQQALIDEGYDVGPTGADGVFGKNTQAAVQAYQKANGLSVDGIAGVNTLGSLYGSSSKTTAADTKATETPANTTPSETTTVTTSPGGVTYGDFSYDPFAPSDIVNQANALIEQHKQNKPGDYTPVWQDEADAYLSQYQNRGPFSYNFNEDAMYLQAKDNYIRQGQMAMMDTMGQAAALTGGYGNSWAQTAGQQMYNQYLGQLNETLPEFQQMAYDRYAQEGQELLAMYDLYMNKENQEYSRYQDGVDDWYRQMGVLQDDYNTKYGQEWDQYVLGYNTSWDEYLTDRSENWDTQQQEMEDAKTKAEILASAGDYSGLQALYGLTDEQVAAIKEANKPKVTTGGSPTSQYKTLSWDEKDRLRKIFGGATSTENLAQLASIYGAGYDPTEIDEIMRLAAPELYYKDPEEPEEPEVDPFEEEKEKRRLYGKGIATSGGGKDRVYMLKE